MTVASIEGYREYLAERNGEADLLNRRLTTRETFFANIEANPIVSRRTIDSDAFEQEAPESAVPPQTSPLNWRSSWRRPSSTRLSVSAWV